MYDQNMKLSAIMPVYNEEATITEILTKLTSVPTVKEVIVVNDGSTDKTEQKIKRLLSSKKKGVKKISYFKKQNGGKGTAIRYGLKKATGDYVIIQDADLEYDPDDIPSLVKHIKKGRVDVVYGSRFLGPHSNLLFWHRVGNDFLNFLVNILYDTTLTDMETCYKVLPTDLFRELDIQSNKFDMEPEITCKLLKRGINIFEVPITYVGRDFSEGKKISWRDGIDALRVIFGLRILP
jgi:glycosyltransferase involved in cell wall biosynthesis